MHFFTRTISIVVIFRISLVRGSFLKTHDGWNPGAASFSPSVQHQSGTDNTNATLPPEDYASYQIPLQCRNLNTPNVTLNALPRTDAVWNAATRSWVPKSSNNTSSSKSQPISNKYWACGAEVSWESKQADEFFDNLSKRKRKLFLYWEGICKMIVHQGFNNISSRKERADHVFVNFDIRDIKDDYIVGYFRTFQYNLIVDKVPSYTKFCGWTFINDRPSIEACKRLLSYTFGNTVWQAVKNALFYFKKNQWGGDTRDAYFELIFWNYRIDSDNMPNTYRFCRNYTYYDPLFVMGPIHPKYTNNKIPFVDIPGYKRSEKKDGQNNSDKDGKENELKDDKQKGKNEVTVYNYNYDDDDD